MEYVDQLRIFLDVVIATVMTGLVGVERETADKPAGLRTNMIVGGATCLIVSITVPLVHFISEYNPDQLIRTDPIRVLEALVVGVSFIGAGTIIKTRMGSAVKGLTTSATLLYCCGIGICIALKQYVLAGCVTVLIIIVNYIVKRLVSKFSKSGED